MGKLVSLKQQEKKKRLQKAEQYRNYAGNNLKLPKQRQNNAKTIGKSPKPRSKILNPLEISKLGIKRLNQC